MLGRLIHIHNELITFATDFSGSRTQPNYRIFMDSVSVIVIVLPELITMFVSSQAPTGGGRPFRPSGIGYDSTGEGHKPRRVPPLPYPMINLLTRE